MKLKYTHLKYFPKIKSIEHQISVEDSTRISKERVIAMNGRQQLSAIDTYMLNLQKIGN